jgi:platelet-activating factor acetylhydrolase
VERAIVLDPWLEPLPTPGPVPYTTFASTGETVAKSSLEDATSSKQGAASSSDPKSKANHSKMLVINSETFTLWKDHYARLKESMAQWGPGGGRILTLGAPSWSYPFTLIDFVTH